MISKRWRLIKLNYKLLKLKDIVLFLLKRSKVKVFTVIAFSIFSQIFLLISYFLPLKVLILLSGGKIPNVFMTFFNLTQESIILGLTISVFVIYYIHIICEKKAQVMIVQILLNFGISKKNTNKSCFEYKFIENFLKILSTFILILILIILLLIVYPTIGIFILIDFLILYIFLRRTNLGKQKYDYLIKIFSSSGFMLVFLLQVVDILYLHINNSSISLVLIALVISRYIFTRLYSVLNKVLFIYSSYSSFFTKVTKNK